MDFVSKRYWFFLISLAVILPGVVFLIIAPGLRPGIDFTGGSSITLQFTDSVSQEDIRRELSRVDQPDATVQKLDEGMYFVRTTELDEEAKTILVETVKASLSPGGVDVLSFDLVSPVVAHRTVVKRSRNGLGRSSGNILLHMVGVPQRAKPLQIRSSRDPRAVSRHNNRDRHLCHSGRANGDGSQHHVLVRSVDSHRLQRERHHSGISTGCGRTS